MPKPANSLSWNDLIASHTGFLRKTANSLTKDYDQAKDLAQDAAIKALLNEDKFDKSSNLKAWLATIVRNTFITNYQRGKKQGDKIDVDWWQNNGLLQHSVDNEANGEILRQELGIAIESLPDVYKSCIEDRIQGYKYEEIAERENIPVGTVKNRIFKARELIESSIRLPKKTIMTIPVEKQKLVAQNIETKWASVASYLAEVIPVNDEVVIRGSDIAKASGWSLSQAGQVLSTMLELKYLKRRQHENYLLFYYSFGERPLNELNVVEAHRLTIERTTKSIVRKKQENKERRAEKIKPIVSDVIIPKPLSNSENSDVIDIDKILETATGKTLAEVLDIKEPVSKSVLPGASKPFIAEKIQSKPKRLGYFCNGEYTWFENDQDAISSAVSMLNTNNQTEIKLVREAGSIKLEPKVELY